MESINVITKSEFKRKLILEKGYNLAQSLFFVMDLVKRDDAGKGNVISDVNEKINPRIMFRISIDEYTYSVKNNT